MDPFELPPGFELEEAPAAPAAPAPVGLPEGFRLEEEEGLTGTVTYEGPNPTSNPADLQRGLKQMLDDRRPLDEVRQWVRSSGYALDADDDAWLEQHYGSVAPGQGFTVDQPDAIPEPMSAGKAAWRGLQASALRGFDDEIAGFGGAVGNKIGNFLGMNESTADFWNIYEQVRNKQRASSEKAWQDNALAYSAGFVPGMFTGPSFARLAKPGASRMDKLKEAATIGAAEGAVSGAGSAEDGFVDRAAGALTGGFLGAGLGAVAYPVASAASTIGGRIKERILPRPENALNSGLEALVRRAPQDTDRMTAQIAELEAANVPARLADVVDESGRGVIGAAARRMTPARQEVTDAADVVYTSAQDRVADQARRNITDRPETARQLSTQIAEEQKAMGPRFDAVRDNPVEVTEELEQALSTPEGRSVLRSIGRYMTAAERGQLDALVSGLQKRAKDGTPEQQAAKMVPGFERMSPAAQAQVMQQLGIESAPLAMTVDVADKFARLITARANDNPGLQRVAADYAETVRGAARQQYPEYDAALNDFAAAARVGDAAAGAGRFEGNSEFLRTPPDQFGATVSSASTEPAAIRGTATEDPSVDEGMLAAIKAHTAGDEMFAEAVNQYLRNPGKFTQAYGVSKEFVEKYLSDMARFTGRSALNEPTTLYRGMVAINAPDIERQIQNGFFELPKPASFTSDAKVSETYSDTAPMMIGDEEADALMAGVRLVVDAPAGARVGGVDEITGDDLKEYIIAGVDRLPIKSATVAEDGTRIITLDGSKLPTRPQAQPTVSEADALRLRARDEVVDRATAGSGAQAMGVARQLSRGTAQRQRNEALLGADDARNLEAGMAAEVTRVDNTRAIDPRIGSQTAQRASDSGEGGDEVLEAVQGTWPSAWGVARSAARWLQSQGIRGVDAERLARDAISEDPAKVRAAVEFLKTRGLEVERARSLVRAMAAQAGGRAAGALSSSQEPRSKPNSVRAYLREGN